MTALLVPRVEPTGTRLHFLDGIRGLAALYVLLFHSLTISVPQDGESLSFAMRTLRSVFGYGHFAVAVFIVLSGFSLMLPMAKKSTTQLRGGFGHYMGRRCRRVLPAYYGALLVSILALLGAGIIPGSANGAADEALRPGSLFSHLLLVHNWNVDWAYRINGPMWSVATEFQIYLLFPLVLLPLWRRIGPWPTIGLAWFAALAVHFSLGDDANLSWAAPWFVGSFALGMGAATIAAAGGTGNRYKATVPWGWTALAALAGLVVILAAGGRNWPLPLLDAIVSVMAVAWILACVARHAPTIGDNSTLNRFLGSHPLVVLGSFSYSLYLLQHPLLRLTESLLGEASLSYEAVLWIQLVVFTPIIMVLSWMFAEFFELPFTTGSHIVAAVRRWLPSNPLPDHALAKLPE